MVKNNISTKLSTPGKLFLARGCANYFLKYNTKITPSEFLELVARYNKLNNVRYLEIFDMEVKSNGS